MATIQERKLKNGTTHYRAIVRQKGNKSQSKTFRRKTDAKEWARKTETEMVESQHFKTRIAKRRTVSELVEKYKDEILPYKTKIMHHQASQLDWWEKNIGHLFLSEISPRVLSEYRDRLLNTPIQNNKPRSPATVNRYMAALSHAFTIAVEDWEWLQENPLNKVRRLTESRGRTRFLSPEEVNSLLQACETSPCKPLYPIVIMALSTGARKMEILRLRWRDINLRRETITLDHTKNGEIRVVPLKGQALKMIKDMKKVRRIDTELLFPGNNPQSPIEFRKHWLKALEDAEIDDFKFHDLRHTAASYLAMNGASLVEISNILGHKTLDMVKRYAHLTEDHTAGVIERMNESILG